MIRIQPQEGEVCKYSVHSINEDDGIEEDVLQTALVPMRIVQTSGWWFDIECRLMSILLLKFINMAFSSFGLITHHDLQLLPEASALELTYSD